MHTLHMRLTPEATTGRVLATLHAAWKLLDLDATDDPGIEKGDRYVYVGMHEDLDLIEEAAELIDRLSQGQATALIDYTYTDEDAEPLTDPTLPYKLAIVLMGATSGKALDAIAAAINLRAVTGDEVYQETVLALTASYPVLAQIVEENER